MTEDIIPVILCGGSGTRLWPASRPRHPKQFLSLIGENSLLQDTALRAMRVSGAGPGKLVTVTLAALADKVQEHLSDVDPQAATHILREPSARNTAAAVAYAAAYVERAFGKDTVLWILPADHHIGDEMEMKAAFLRGVSAAEEGYLVTFGIRPTRPDTGYGYIRLGLPLGDGAVRRAEAFVEKPDAETARGYLAQGDYLWNSGMFLFSTEVLLAEYERHAPDILAHLRAAMADNSDDHYAAIRDIPFDKAVMEKSARVAVIPCNPAWSDIGSWESLWDIGVKDAGGNVASGNAICHGVKDCLIQAGKRLVACAGVENLVVVETVDALLIANRGDADSLRALVKEVNKAARHDGTGPAMNGAPFNPAYIPAAGVSAAAKPA